MSEYIWKPSEEFIKNANVTAFLNRHEIPSFDDLLLRASTGTEWFWDQCTHFTNLSWFEPYIQTLDMSEGFPFAKWFVGGRINITYNCVDRHAEDKKTAGKVAYYWQGECGAEKKVTYEELYKETNQVANYLKSIGVGKEDYVALYMPMIAELMPVYFAILKIGAVVVPIFSGFGTDAVSVRFNDAKVKAVFTADGTLRRGKNILLKNMLQESLDACPSIEKCIVVKRLFVDDVPMTEGRDVFYQDVISDQSTKCQSEELLSEHQSMVIYTSGTTGKPKGTVHTHAGVLAQVAKEHFFHFDLKPEDNWFWVTDIGWMMGPWEMIGATHFGASLVIMEGAPIHPEVDRVFEVCKKFQVSHLGISPTLIRLLMREDEDTISKHNLKDLRMIGSTGEPWDTDSYMWCFDKIGKKKVPIINISGGTEIMGCLLAPLPVKPLKACSLQGPAFGMNVDIFTEGGYPAKPNEVGYLVCKRPAPSMTKGFLHDNQRYLETYFSKFRNIWNHGDWAVRDEDGEWFLKGRADDTIKIAGKRTGPSEIESAACDHPFISEACAIGVPDEIKGESVVSFLVLKKDIGPTESLKRDVKQWLGEKLGKTLIPKDVYFVKDLPKTRSGKIVRGTIKKKYLGQDLGDLASLENQNLIEEIPSLQSPIK